jgi:hypothetical protein
MLAATFIECPFESISICDDLNDQSSVIAQG